MTALAAAIGVIFTDPNLALDALLRAGCDGPGVPIRVVRRAPDRITGFGEGRFVTDALLLDIRVQDAPELAAGDTVEIAGEILVIRGEPVRDSERLVWSAEARAT